MILYGIALLVSFLTVGAGMLFVRSARAEVHDRLEQFKQDLKAQKAAGQLPPEWQNTDLDNLRLENVGMQVTAGVQIRLDIAAWLEEFDFVWVPFVVLTCFGLAALLDWLWRSRVGG